MASISVMSDDTVASTWCNDLPTLESLRGLLTFAPGPFGSRHPASLSPLAGRDYPPARLLVAVARVCARQKRVAKL